MLVHSPPPPPPPPPLPHMHKLVHVCYLHSQTFPVFGCLQYTQEQQLNNANPGMGWSSTIQGQSPHSTNVQGSLDTQRQSTALPQNLMGWSSNIAARPQPKAASSATGWSQNIGMSQPQGSGTGMGMGWTGGMQGVGGGQLVVGQPSAASVMMGSGQPLVPQNTSSVAHNSQHLVLTLLQGFLS